MMTAAAVSQLLLTLAFSLRKRRESAKFTALAAMAFGAILYLLGAWARFHAHWPGGYAVFWVAAAAMPCLVWIVTEALTQERFTFRRRHGVVFGMNAAAHASAAAIEGLAGVPRLLFGTNMVLVFGFAAAMLAVVGRHYGRQRPTLRRTRQTRLLALTGSAVLLVGLGYTVVPNAVLARVNEEVDVIAVVCAVVAFYLNWHLLTVDPQFARLDRTADTASAAEASLGARVLRAMRDEHAYLKQDLTMRSFAAALGAPEATVRSVIMKELAFANFDDFVNHYRITEAAKRLRDPELAHVKIAAVAFDCGFSSLSPFNRAFRAVHGQTPSEFRQLAA